MARLRRGESPEALGPPRRHKEEREQKFTHHLPLPGAFRSRVGNGRFEKGW